MRSSKNEQVQNFLDDINAIDPDKSAIVQELRDVVFQAEPKVSERMMYGGIMLTLSSDFGGIFVYKKHISFEFSNGMQMDDPDNILEGSGKFRRHAKIYCIADVETKNIAYFVRQAIRLS